MANPPTQKMTVERCWTLIGRQQGCFWYARRMRPTKGDPASVQFDAAWVSAREEAKRDVIGFYHTHPSGMPCPSQRDDRTMRAWVGSFGKPLLCLIEADGIVSAYAYADDEAKGVPLTGCELFPRGVVVAYHDRVGDQSEVNDGR